MKNLQTWPALTSHEEVCTLQVAVIAYLGVNSIDHLKAHKLPLAAAVGIILGLLKEAGDYLQV